MYWRNILSVGVNLRNFHSVHCTLWKLRKFTLTEKIFRQITYLVISLVKLLLSQHFCQKSVRVDFRNFHTVVYTVWKNEKFTLTSHRRNISSNQLELFSKTLLSRNFGQKSVRVDFRNFQIVWHTVQNERTKKNREINALYVVTSKQKVTFTRFF